MDKLICVILLLGPVAGPVSATFLGEFRGTSLQADASVESPAVSESIRSAVAPKAGESVVFQLFAFEAGGKATLGYNLEFGMSWDRDFLSTFSVSGRDFQGNELMITEERPVASALLIGKPEYPANGYLGTITLTALVDVPAGTTIMLLSTTSLADVDSQNDKLDVSQAFITLTDADFVEAIPGDINLDGSVDFTDFLTLATNFGRTGPVPSPLGVGTPQTVVVRDTIETVRTIVRVDTVFTTRTIRDTLWRTSTNTIRDTVFVSQGGSAEGGPFDGFYILSLLRIASPLGITLDFEPPIVTGGLSIEDPFLSLFVTAGPSTNSIATLGMFLATRDFASGAGFYFFDVILSDGSSETWSVISDGQDIVIAISDGPDILLLGYLQWDGLSKPTVRFNERSFDRLLEYHRARLAPQKD